MSTGVYYIVMGLIILVVGYVCPPVVSWLKSHNALEKLKTAQFIIEKTVLAIQQTMNGESGWVKNSKAKEIIKAALAKYGIEITDQQLDDFIEAAVFAMKNPGK